MSPDEYHTWAKRIEGWLANAYIKLKGAMPDTGGFHPDEETVEKAVAIFASEAEMQKYCETAIYVHLYNAQYSGTQAPFFVNSRLLSRDMVKNVEEKGHLVRQRYKSTLNDPTEFFTEVYRDVKETEYRYLMMASEFAFRDMPFQWSYVLPSYYWYLLVVTGVDKMACNRMGSTPPPQDWFEVPVDYKGRAVDLKVAVNAERTRLKGIDVRNVFIQAAEKALIDAARQWGESYGLIRLYLDRNNRVAVSPEFSQLSSIDIDIRYPLEERDRQMFARAKDELDKKGVKFPDLHVQEDQTPDEETSTGVFRQNSSLNEAFAELERNLDA